MKISIVTRNNGNAELEFAHELQATLYKNHSVDVLPLGHSWTNLIKCPLNQSDLVISVGGDGTLLQVISKMQVQRPIVGVNFGGVGFLTDLEKSNAIDKICEITHLNHIPVEKRMRIDLLSDGQVIGTALNEIAFKVDYTSAKYTVKIDNVIATEFKGDGVLIATPTGSTAYALSAGGAIADPRTNGFLMVPIAPFLLSSRPLVIHGSRHLTVNADDGIILVDGQKLEHVLPSADKTFECKISDHPALFIDVGRNFFEKVNTKLKHV
jgi:NAD+ kinase